MKNVIQTDVKYKVNSKVWTSLGIGMIVSSWTNGDTTLYAVRIGNSEKPYELSDENVYQFSESEIHTYCGSTTTNCKEE